MIKNFLSLVTVGFLPYLINFFTLPLYGNYIDAEGFGLIGLVTTTAAIASTWTGVQLSGSLARFYFDYEGESLKDYTTSIIISTIVITLSFGGLYCVSSYYLIKLLDLAISMDLVFTTIALTILSVVNTLFERLLINQQAGTFILVRSIFSQGISVALGLYFVIIENMSYLGFLLASTFYYVLMISLAIPRSLDLLQGKFSSGYLKQSLTYSYPLIFHALSGVAFMYSTIYFIEAFLALSLVGVFFIIDKFTQIIKQLVNSTNNVIMPIYNKISVRCEDEGQKFIETLIPIWFAGFSLINVLFVYVAFKYLAEFMGEDYQDSFHIISLMSSAYLFRGLYCFGASPIFFFKKTKYIALITGITGLASLPINYFFIINWGFSGAALSVFSLFAISFLLTLCFSRKIQLIKFNFLNLFKQAVFFLILAKVLSYLFIDLNFWQSIFTGAVIFSLSLFVLYTFDFFKVKTNILALKSMDM